MRRSLSLKTSVFSLSLLIFFDISISAIEEEKKAPSRWSSYTLHIKPGTPVKMGHWHKLVMKRDPLIC